MEESTLEWVRSALVERLVNETEANAESDSEATRMTINQITFAILISVLLVANTYLVWCLAYIVIAHEKLGRHNLRLLYSSDRYSNKSSPTSSTISTKDGSAIS